MSNSTAASRLNNMVNDGSGTGYSHYDNASTLEKALMIAVGGLTAVEIVPAVVLAAAATVANQVAAATVIGPLAETASLALMADEAGVLMAARAGVLGSAGGKFVTEGGLFGRKLAQQEMIGSNQLLEKVVDSKAAKNFELHTHIESALVLNVKTKVDSAVFWSGRGNRVLAEEFASHTGRVTLEMTVGGRQLDSLGLFQTYSYENAIKPWEILSRRYAENASGEVFAFVENSSAQGLYTRVEKPVLMSNKNVTRIVDQIEFEILKRYRK